jgi:hypothetical protein
VRAAADFGGIRLHPPYESDGSMSDPVLS